MAFDVRRHTVLIAFLSLILGFFLNYWSTKIANNKLKNELLAELTALNNVQSSGRTSAGEDIRIQQRKNEIEAQIKILSR